LIFYQLFNIITAILALMSMVGVALILAYLINTERKAPNIVSSTDTSEIGSKKIQYFPLISVIIAAKNESQLIERCVTSLRTQTYPNFEIILVDDSSADNTLEIAGKLAATDSRIKVVEAGDKPTGWLGKSWPCQLGFNESKGEIVLFVDADSRFDSRTLNFTIDHFENNCFDMYSISPRIELHGVWSRAIVPLLSSTINLLYPMIKVNDPSNKRAYVFGTFILVRRSVYKAIGGHERVKNTLVEDAAIGENAKSNGFKLYIEKGNGLVATEWETSFRAIYQGVERIFSDSIRSYGPSSVLNSILMFFLGLYPIAFIIAFLLEHPYTSVPWTPVFIFLLSGFIASVLSVIFVLLVVSFELWQITGSIGPYPFLYPIGFLLYISAILTTSKKVFTSKPLTWKGTSYTHNNLSNPENLEGQETFIPKTPAI
jgi:chlorobactene glucosyltransferase